MPTTIRTGESYITIFYRLVLPDGLTFVVAVTPLDPDTASRVIGFVTEDYVMISPITPPGVAAFFLRGIFLSPDYVGQCTFLTGDALALLTYLLPKLTQLLAADLIAEAADDWDALRR
jgi:hypothetical protein